MGLKEAKFIREMVYEEQDCINQAELDISKAKVYLGGKTQVNNSTPPNKSWNILALIGLGILLLILIVLALITARYVIGEQPATEVIFMENTRVIERQVQMNTTNTYEVVIPEGERETCIQLDNESFRRCFDEI